MSTRLLAAVLCCLVLPAAALAEDSPWSAGLRAGMSTAGGVPSNDSVNMALAVRYALDDRRHLGFALEQMTFDFERPHKVVGLQQDFAAEPEDIDAKTTSLLYTVSYEQHHGLAAARWRPYWSLQFAVCSPDVDDVTGPVQGGGTFDVRTDAGTEYIPGARAGYLWQFAGSWSADFSATVNHHFADWKVEDRQSGNRDRVDDYTHYGAQLGLRYRFGER